MPAPFDAIPPVISAFVHPGGSQQPDHVIRRIKL
jgi:hypothetical protein